MAQTQAQFDLLHALMTLNALGKKPDEFNSPQDMRARVDALNQLPPLPEMARRILALRTDPTSDARKLAQIVEMDPPLAAQVIRWGNSALFGFSNRIVTVKDAITLVLGFDTVFNLAFTLCALNPLKSPADGPLGKRFFWRQTLAGSALMQKLAQLMPPESRPDPANVHLVYLLHNTGHFLLSHLFPGEFDYLTRIVTANPDTALLPIERLALGVDHTQLGAWLMRGWSMPGCLETVVLHHHNPYYRGEHESLVWLTCLTDRLLGQVGIGDACNNVLEDTPLFSNLQLDSTKAEDCRDKIMEAREELETAVAALS